MYVEMLCSCEAHFTVEDGAPENTDAVWLLLYRFANAHTECGYMTSGTSDEAVPTHKKRVVKPRRTPEEDQE